MAGPRAQSPNDVSLALGRRLSRRTFLRSAAAVGVAAIGLERGAAGRLRQPGVFGGSVAEQIVPDSIAALADALFYDIEAIFRFVADDIRYQPYSGALRGADGTLAARAGNSVDQALLLAALLDASFIPYRFATGALDRANVDRLGAGAQADAESFTDHAFAALAGTRPGAPAVPAPALDAAAQSIMDIAIASQEQIVSWAQGQVDSTTSAIQMALDAAGFEVPSRFTEVPDREVEGHTWVQALQGVDWLDLDPSLNGTTIGEVLTTVAGLLDEVPDELFHRVDLEVIGEAVAGDSVLSQTLLRLSTRADLVAGRPITFLNASPSGIERLGELITPIAGTLSYVPTIIIGEEAFAGIPIRFGRGNVLGGELFGDIEEILDGAVPAGEASAQWLEIAISSPDREPVVVRRAIFDRFGPAARAAGALDPTAMRPADEISLDASDSPEILPALSTTWLAVNVGSLDRDAPIMAPDDSDPGAPAVFAQGHHVLREISDLALGLPLGLRSFADAPNVAAYTVAPRTSPDGEQMVELGFDIWHRSHGVLPVLDAGLVAGPMLVAGILDHVAERLLSGAAMVAPLDDAAAIASVGAVFEAASRDGIPLRALGLAEEVDLLDYPPDAAALLKESLGDGWLAVAPERAVAIGAEERVGWWLIDAATGATVDQLDDGRGASIEYQATLTPGQLVRETAQRKLARDCLAGSMLHFASFIGSICAGVAIAHDRSGVAMACGAGAGSLATAAVIPMVRCAGAAFPG